jgi:hypothetical protein
MNISSLAYQRWRSRRIAITQKRSTISRGFYTHHCCNGSALNGRRHIINNHFVHNVPDVYLSAVPNKKVVFEFLSENCQAGTIMYSIG